MTDDLAIGVRERVAAAYEGYYGLLQYIAVRRYKIPKSEIRPLIHDVFVAFMRHASLIGDDRRWLTTAITNACLNYWRDAKPATTLPDDLLDRRRVVDAALARHDVTRVFTRLSAECQRVLRLHYVDGLDGPEIGQRLSIKPGSVRVKIHRCLERARRILAELL
ncbi:MAG TPA: sigma-70 family RNA polymerase sigma factor [Thermoanaerobaculia bacterium]